MPSPPAHSTFLQILPHMFKIRPNFKMYHAMVRSIFIGEILKIPHLKALALRILNLVSDYLYDDRFGRERAKRVRVKAFKLRDICLE